MAPKKKDSGSAAPATATHEYAVGDIVLGKVKGYPDWPAQVRPACPPSSPSFGVALAFSPLLP